MNLFAFLKSKPKPREIITTRASHKAWREAEADYASTHAKLAQEVGRPVPAHLAPFARAQKGQGNA